VVRLMTSQTLTRPETNRLATLSDPPRPLRTDAAGQLEPALPRPADGRQDGAAASRWRAGGLDDVDPVLPGDAAARVRVRALRGRAPAAPASGASPGRARSRPADRAADRAPARRDAAGPAGRSAAVADR